MDIAQLSQLPLTVLVILGAYWVIQRLNDEHAKQLIALTASFLAKYEDVIKRAEEDREDSRLRWLERDKHLIALIIDVKDTVSRTNGEMKEALLTSANQDHALRGTLQPLVLWWQREQRNIRPPRQGDDADAADRAS